MDGLKLGHVNYDIVPRVGNQPTVVNEREEQQTGLIARVNQIYAKIGVKNLAVKVALSPLLLAAGLAAGATAFGAAIVAAPFYGLYLMNSSRRFTAN